MTIVKPTSHPNQTQKKQGCRNGSERKETQNLLHSEQPRLFQTPRAELEGAFGQSFPRFTTKTIDSER